MNVLEQLRAMGLVEEPYRFDTGGGTFDGYAGVDTGGPGLGPGGTELSSEISSTAGGTGRGTVSIAGPVSPESPEVLAAYAAGRLSNFDWGSPQGKEAASILAQLDAMGYGKMEGANPNNPTQTVENLLASATTSSLAPLALSFMPGMGIARGIQTGAQLVADLSSGKLSPQDAFTDLALSIASSVTGQSKGTLAAAARGDFGTAVMSAAKDAIIGTVAQNIGAPASIVGAAFNAGLNALGSGTTLGGTSLASSGAPAPSETQTGDSGAGVSPSVMEALAELAPASERDISSIMPLLSAASISNMVKQQKESEQKEQEALSELLAIKSPFGEMPYDNSFMRG